MTILFPQELAAHMTLTELLWHRPHTVSVLPRAMAMLRELKAEDSLKVGQSEEAPGEDDSGTDEEVEGTSAKRKTGQCEARQGSVSVRPASFVMCLVFYRTRDERILGNIAVRSFDE
jgi:hypothetical protein